MDTTSNMESTINWIVSIVGDNSKLQTENEALKNKFGNPKELKIGCVYSNLNSNRVLETSNGPEGGSKNLAYENLKLIKAYGSLKILHEKNLEENNYLREQLKESIPNKSLTISQLKSELEELKVKHQTIEGQNNELISKKDTLEELQSKSAEVLLSFQEIIIESDNFKSEVKKNYISKRKHKEIIKEQKKLIKSLQSEIQSFRNEFMHNITTIPNNDNEMN